MIGHLIEELVGIIWNVPVVGLCLLGAFYFTWQLKAVQLTGLGHAIGLISGKYDDPNEHGQITHFQALSAALSGTIGLGNIAGVAVAISYGGPGTIFWMWIVAFLGMATKFVECTLGTAYRDEDPETGEVRGGPMHYITKGLGQKWHWVAVFYGIAIFLGSFGAGNMFQSNQAALALQSAFSVPTEYTGIVLTVLVGIVILGGIKRIGQVASKIVPLMCVTYILGALYICFSNITLVPHALNIILTEAFSGSAITGGALGTTIIWGVRRAIFSNEAGLGSAAIAHAAVKTNYPIREGIVASLGPLIDTIIVCTSTAIVIVLAGLYSDAGLSGITLTTASFDHFFTGFGSYFISTAVFLFAFSTLITWYYYGETAVDFVFGKKMIQLYKVIFVSVTFIGSINSLSLVLNFSDLMIGLLVIPNMIALILLAPKVKKMKDEYFAELKAGNLKTFK